MPLSHIILTPSQPVRANGKEKPFPTCGPDGTLTHSGERPWICRRTQILHEALCITILIIFHRCLHKTGGSLPYKPGKCTKIIECAMRLHNLAIDLKVPLMEAVELHDVDNDQDFAPTFENMTAAALRERIIQRFWMLVVFKSPLILRDSIQICS